MPPSFMFLSYTPALQHSPAGAERVQSFPHPLCCLRGDESSRPKCPGAVGQQLSSASVGIWGFDRGCVALIDVPVQDSTQA
ncbi:hypothetical protein PBY51_012817 [Eleginops maclovinus]|uniref:Uncharacterized protein n=1 Tax=Eleginops maclovinus TaxID=56733 RepID=A0AAN7XXT7_ELEMC|nr:hypothetical protein PBY51_012817 [Eleginops maclovinus]